MEEARVISSSTGTAHKVALVAFAKNPELVPVKTRLSISLGQNQAALIYTGLLEDCLEQLKSFSGADLFLACYPDRDGDFFKRIQYRHGISLIDQKGEDLGERILDCIGNLLDSHNSVFIFGSDVPLLPIESIKEMLNHINYWDVVLGPSSDGGYYALGAKRISCDMLSGIEWGGKSVLLDTVKNCVRNNLEVAFLDLCDDIDDQESLDKLLVKLEQPGDVAPATRAVLKRLKMLP